MLLLTECVDRMSYSILNKCISSLLYYFVLKQTTTPIYIYSNYLQI